MALEYNGEMYFEKQDNDVSVTITIVQWKKKVSPNFV